MVARPLVSRVREGKEQAGAKFADYFEFAEPFTKLPSHRILAMFRGEKEEILDLTWTRRTTPARAASYETADRRPVRRRRPGPAGRPLAGRDGALGLADPDRSCT